ncbi:hypothetical protein [Halolamina salina]|uniref:Uncharacterized protein n=1 Tax=Halolamina salina TaxID=1220023 RepID=A0ABD6B947_9EURY
MGDDTDGPSAEADDGLPADDDDDRSLHRRLFHGFLDVVEFVLSLF